MKINNIISNSTILFETERTIVRAFAETDGDAFFGVNGDPEVVRFIRPVKTREECEAFLLENIRLYQPGSLIGRYGVFAKAGGTFLGIFSLLYMSGESVVHLGYALVPEAWGQGYATELSCAGVRHFFLHTGHPCLYAITVAENQASRKVLLKAGFSYQGQAEQGGKMVEVFHINRNLDGVAASAGSSSGA